MANATTARPSIKLYNNHGCPWSHRAHITLNELNLPFEEEIIDLAVPRTAEYLKINPRGTLPSLVYNGEIITDSAIVAQFLVDTHPSHLLPPSDREGAALRRAQVNFFVDAYFSKAVPVYFKIFAAKTSGESESLTEDFIDVLIKEVEPLLADAAPYFGGSDELTMAEVLSASFIIRLFSFAKYGLLPQSLLTSVEERTPNFHKWSQVVVKHPSITSIYDEEAVVEAWKAHLAKMKGAK